MTVSSSPEGSAPSPLSSAQVKASTTMFDLGKGRQVTHQVLTMLLPDIDTALFFAKAYDLSYARVSELVQLLFQSDIITALLGEADQHSAELQDYVIELVPDVHKGELSDAFTDTTVKHDTEMLAQLWQAAEVEIAKSIAEVATKIGGVLNRLPSKYGTMTFSHLRKLNTQRNSIGVFGAQIQHQRVAPRLVVLDVSGSMTQRTVETIVDEVVALAYQANASLAIVSDAAFLWGPGEYSTAVVLKAAQYGSTRYETLAPIFDEDWETVITIADYDSAWTAQDYLANNAKGRVHQVLDISLVNRPTFLAECIGRIADEVKPLLVGNSQYLLT